MVSRCANPNCTAQLRYLHQGRLFVIWPSKSTLVPEQRIRYVWLCDSCCRTMTVTHDAKLAPFDRAAPAQQGQSAWSWYSGMSATKSSLKMAN